MSKTVEDASGSNWARYWDEARETMDPVERRGEILARIKHQLAYVYDELPFYRTHYDAHGFHPSQVQTLEDFTARVPTINKKMLVADQAANPTFGSYTPDLPIRDIARIHGSSGTSGVPTLYAVSDRDWQRAADVHAMAQWCGGIRPDDLVQIGFPFGLFFGGWGVIQGAERIGAAVFPLGVAESERHIEFIERLRPTVFSATPSYCMHLIGVAERMGFDLRSSSVRTLVVGGEPGGSLPGTRLALSSAWAATVIDAGSTSEMYPFQTNVSCTEDAGIHLIEDEVFTEIVHRDDLNVPVEDGERGAIIYTHLWRDSQPMIRFAPGDESYIDRSTCACGRTYPRLPEGVLGRLDDMLVVRGANIFPSAIETALRSVDGLGPEFQIRVTRPDALDEISVITEYAGDINPELSRQLTAEVEAAVRRAVGIRVPVTLVAQGELPATVFKARRVVDDRGTL